MRQIRSVVSERAAFQHFTGALIIRPRRLFQVKVGRFGRSHRARPPRSWVPDEPLYASIDVETWPDVSPLYDTAEGYLYRDALRW